MDNAKKDKEYADFVVERECSMDDLLQNADKLRMLYKDIYQ